jgi:excinuclease ABC subunit A
VLVVEHNTDIILHADWVIELGPGAGAEGGELVYAGTPQGLKKCKQSFTAKYL